MRLEDVLRQGLRLLEASSVPSPRIAAEVLLMHALRCDRAHLYAHPERELSHTERVLYARYLRERMSGRPTQYITGRQEFWGMQFRVTPAVFIPRPETEHVVERAVELGRTMKAPEPPVVLDVGTGSGCIAIAVAVELPRARVIATDISSAALEVASENAARLVGRRLHFCRCDLLAAVATASAHLVLSNPPYVPQSQEAGVQREIRDFEPRQAVFAGPEGMEFYTALVPEAARVLRPGGWAVFELGYNMADCVHSLFGEGWTEVEIRPDLAGIPRVIAARRSIGITIGTVKAAADLP